MSETRRCPACGIAALNCVSTEGRTGSPCCADCALQTFQQPMHVWPDGQAWAGPQGQVRR